MHCFHKLKSLTILMFSEKPINLNIFSENLGSIWISYNLFLHEPVRLSFWYLIVQGLGFAVNKTNSVSLFALARTQHTHMKYVIKTQWNHTGTICRTRTEIEKKPRQMARPLNLRLSYIFRELELFIKDTFGSFLS